MLQLQSHSYPHGLTGLGWDKDVQTLAAGFRRLSVGCLTHSANFVAHSLALYAGQLDGEILWLEESPPPTLDALYLDSISLNE